MRALLVFLEKQPLLVALSLCAVPYVGLRLYLGEVMHADAALAEAATPHLPRTRLAASEVYG